MCCAYLCPLPSNGDGVLLRRPSRGRLGPPARQHAARHATGGCPPFSPLLHSSSLFYYYSYPLPPRSPRPRGEFKVGHKAVGTVQCRWHSSHSTAMAFYCSSAVSRSAPQYSCSLTHTEGGRLILASCDTPGVMQTPVPGLLGSANGGTDFNDCVHPFARLVVEGLWGYRPDYPNGRSGGRGRLRGILYIVVVQDILVVYSSSIFQ